MTDVEIFTKQQQTWSEAFPPKSWNLQCDIRSIARLLLILLARLPLLRLRRSLHTWPRLVKDRLKLGTVKTKLRDRDAKIREKERET